jgi:hypothetical protein
VARLLAAYCDAAARLDPARGRLVDYPTLPDAVWSTIAPHFGLTLDPQARTHMELLSRMQSKSSPDKSVPFVEDSAAKRAAASPALARAVTEIARPALDRLRVASAARD